MGLEERKVCSFMGCKCEKPKSDGKIRVGKYEGTYTLCKKCKKRIWN